jgi:hypothetical protein
MGLDITICRCIAEDGMSLSGHVLDPAGEGECGIYACATLDAIWALQSFWCR